MNSSFKPPDEAFPSDGLSGLRDHWLADAKAGFVVFLLALPLSLGIAKASEFPPLMGLITAIIGGMVTSFLAGSRLSVKGPAAGLIVILAGAVTDFGGGITGWHLALGALVAAGVLQILFGLFRLGRLIDFFPLTAIHGMLAAIGLIIIAKQIPVLLDINPADYRGLSTLDSFAAIPRFLLHLDPRATLIGVLSLAILIGWPHLRQGWLKQIPAPLAVLAMAIPAELLMDFQHTEPPYALVHIGNLLDSVQVNVDFSGAREVGLFIKYVLLISVIGSLESLLTVKAVDLMDPWHRKSDPNRDLMAVGVGNTLAAVLGGLPMISEVARSSANVAQGAKTRWANFFHGLFLLAFVLLAMPLIEMIPNTALAAMLIMVGVKLSHPKEFVRTIRIGREQLLIFVVTIFFTLAEDLLVGMLAGMTLEIVLHWVLGTPVSSFFKAQARVSFEGDQYLVEINQSAIFTNFLGIKNKLHDIPPGFQVIIDLTSTRLVDHSAMENLHQFQREYEREGGKVFIVGLNEHRAVSEHQLAARVK